MSRILGIPLAACLFVAPFAGTAAAAPGVDISIPIDTVVRAEEGSVTQLADVDVPAEAVGQLCNVESQAQNQGSVHPGNDLVVSSGSSQVLLADVEAEPGGTVAGDGLLTLGANITVSLHMGPDEVFSGGFVVVIECETQPEPVEVMVDGECVLEGDSGSGLLTVNMTVDGGASVAIFDNEGAQLAVITESGGTVDVAPGATYVWSASPAAGFEISGDSSGEVDIEDCTPDDEPPDGEVLASIVVTVEGNCEDGAGFIDITISVMDGATVVVSDSDGDVVDTLSSDDTVEVPDGATYTWEATPNEGFEFPSGAASSGSITIESCSDVATLPFTGPETEAMALLASVLILAGVGFLHRGRRLES